MYLLMIKVAGMQSYQNSTHDDSWTDTIVGCNCQFIIWPDSKDEERIKLNKKILTDE